ncbi:MAG: putative eukaryotic translation initiation factor 5b, partial [Streblomastix strix]
HKKDVVRSSIMVEKNKPDYAVVLAFDVRVEEEAQKFADETKVTIFRADIIYHLTKLYSEFMAGLREQRKKEALKKIIYPAKLQYIEKIHESKPIIIGVRILDGTLHRNDPIVSVGPFIQPTTSSAQAKQAAEEKPKAAPIIDMGLVKSIQLDKKSIEQAQRGADVAIEIDESHVSQWKLGNEIKMNDEILTKINRESIDIMKQYMRDSLTPEDWKLVKYLKDRLKFI